MNAKTAAPVGLAFTEATLARSAAPIGPLTFTVSTTRVNRHGYSLRTSGWRLERFRASPTVLYNHDPYELPVGRADVMLAGDRLKAAVTFDQGDEFARTLERKYRGGFLSGVSVGFGFVNEAGAPLDVRRLSAEQIRDEAFYDLHEISCVAVPSDPGAVIDSARLSALSALSAARGRRPRPVPRYSTRAASRTVSPAGARKVLDALTVPRTPEDLVRTALVEVLAARIVDDLLGKGD